MSAQSQVHQGDGADHYCAVCGEIGCVASERAEVERLRKALRYLAFGLEMMADGSVRVLSGAITHAGVRDARSATTEATP